MAGGRADVVTWPTLWDQANALLACAVTELDDNIADGVEGAPARRFFAPGGQVAHDNCCDGGGQLWVRVVKAHPVNPVPTKVLAEVPCRNPIGVHMAAGVTRCSQAVTDDGKAPSTARLNAEAKQMVCDMAALLRALECCVAEDADNRATTLDQWTPLGPAGGCVGGEWTFWWTPRIDCPEEESQ